MSEAIFNDQDIRWVQRLESYQRALKKLAEGVEYATQSTLSELEEAGVIKRFEFTQELSWLVIKDFYEFVGGGARIQGSRDAFQAAFKRGLIKDSVLMGTIKSRNKIVHSYNEDVADKLLHDVVNKYYDAFKRLADALIQEKIQRGL